MTDCKSAGLRSVGNMCTFQPREKCLRASVLGDSSGSISFGCLIDWCIVTLPAKSSRWLPGDLSSFYPYMSNIIIKGEWREVTGLESLREFPLDGQQPESPQS